MSRKKEFNFDLKQLRSYLEVIQEKNFTRASRKLRLGQATISHHIQLLEEILGVRLIERSGKSFSLTGEGILFKEFCEKLFKDIEKLKVDLKQSAATGITKIAASTIPSSYILPDVIVKLKTQNPNFFYRVTVSDSRETVEMIKEGIEEVGISGKRLTHPALTYERICSDEIVLIGSPRHPDSIDINEITELPLIERERGSGTRDSYERSLKKHKITPSALKVVYECSSSESLKEAVASGIGVAFISSLAINRELRFKVFKIIRINGLTITRDFYVLYLKNKRLSVPAGALVKSLQKLDA